MACKTCRDIYDFVNEADKKVDLYSYTTTISDTGGENVTWALLGSYWAAIKPASGREVFQYGNLDSRVSHVITIRYQAALKNTASSAKNKIIYDGRTFVINYIKNFDESMKLEGKYYQQLICEENANEFGDA